MALEAVVGSVTEAAFVKDLRGRYLLANAAGARLLGRPVEEVIGKDDAELFTPYTARRFLKYDREVVDGKAVMTYEDVVTEDEVTRSYLTTKRPLSDAQGRRRRRRRRRRHPRRYRVREPSSRA